MNRKVSKFHSTLCDFRMTRRLVQIETVLQYLSARLSAARLSARLVSRLVSTAIGDFCHLMSAIFVIWCRRFSACSSRRASLLAASLPTHGDFQRAPFSSPSRLSAIDKNRWKFEFKKFANSWKNCWLLWSRQKSNLLMSAIPLMPASDAGTPLSWCQPHQLC